MSKYTESVDCQVLHLSGYGEKDTEWEQIGEKRGLRWNRRPNVWGMVRLRSILRLLQAVNLSEHKRGHLGRMIQATEWSYPSLRLLTQQHSLPSYHWFSASAHLGIVSVSCFSLLHCNDLLLTLRLCLLIHGFSWGLWFSGNNPCSLKLAAREILTGSPSHHQGQGASTRQSSCASRAQRLLTGP